MATAPAEEEKPESSRPTSRGPTTGSSGALKERGTGNADGEPPQERTPSPSIPQQPQEDTFRCRSCDRPVEEHERYTWCTRCKHRVHLPGCVCAPAGYDAQDAAERIAIRSSRGGCMRKTQRAQDATTHRLRPRVPQPERNPEGHSIPRTAKRRDRDRSESRTDRDVDAFVCNYAGRKPKEKDRPAA